MRHIGIVACSAEGAALCYRTICVEGAARSGGYAHPEVTLFFHTDQGVEGVGNVIRNLKLNGKVFTSGFNVSGAILDAVDDGTTLVTIDQGFDNQAQAPVEQCAKYLATGETPADPLQYLRPIVITKAGGEAELSVEAGRDRLKAAAH